MKKIKKKKMSKVVKIIIMLLLVILIILLALALTNDDLEDVVPKKHKKEKEEPIRKINIVNEDSDKRPIAVMIDNNVGNNDHYGLSDAYITYECIVEGGLTRIMAVYKDKDVEKIGPIRSSRHYFLDYALEEDSIYAHYGWSPFAQNDIKALGVNNINGLTDNAYYRDKTKRSPHNVFTSTERLYNYAKEKGYKTSSDNWHLLNYSVDEINLYNNETNTGKVDGVLPANKVDFNFSRSQSRTYNYNTDTKMYERMMNGVNHTDAETGNTLSYKNLIIIKVPNRTLDDYGRQDLTTVGTHDGYFITNGYAAPISAQKLSRKGKTKYTYKNGEEVKFNDGNTFIEVIPVNNNIEIE